MKEKYRIEAIRRMKKAGASEGVIQKLQKGEIPFDPRGVDLPYSAEQLIPLVTNLEKEGELIIYGIQGILLNQTQPGLAFLYISKNWNEEDEQTEMYKGIHPICFYTDLCNAENCGIGFIDIQNNSKTIFRPAL